MSNNDNTPPPWHEEVPVAKEENVLFTGASSIPARQAPPDIYMNSYGIRYDTRTSTAKEINVAYIEHDTGKALLCGLISTTTGETKEVWIPKKLCTNYNEADNLMNVWEVFANDNLKDFI